MMTADDVRPGDRVRLRDTGTAWLDGSYATVEAVCEWGCVLCRAVTETGYYRATWAELERADRGEAA